MTARKDLLDFWFWEYTKGEPHDNTRTRDCPFCGVRGTASTLYWDDAPDNDPPEQRMGFLWTCCDRLVEEVMWPDGMPGLDGTQYWKLVGFVIPEAAYGASQGPG